MSKDTIRVRYIGLKPKCTDSFPDGKVYTWVGNDDVQPLPASALPKLLKHPTVWEIVADEAPAGLSLADAGMRQADGEPKPDAPPTVEQWLTKTADELHAYAALHGIKIDKRLKDADKIRAAIDAATPA